MNLICADSLLEETVQYDGHQNRFSVQVFVVVISPNTNPT